MTAVHTVLGPVAPSALGLTLMHEHLLCDLSGSFAEPTDEAHRSYVHAPVDTVPPAILRQYPFSLCLDNLRLDDMALAVTELQPFLAAGGTALVDCTGAGIGTNPAAVRAIAQQTGLHIVQGTGLHIELNHPEWVWAMGLDELAERFARDVTDGIGASGVRAGLIGEIGTSGLGKHDRVKRGDMTPQEAKVLRAAARAAHQTGAAVAVHLDPRGQGAFGAISLLRAQGVEPERIIMCHMDANPNLDYHLAVAAQGVFVEYDHFGREYYAGHMHRPYGTDARRIELACALVARGYERQLLVSHDICCKIDLCRHGGVGYGHLLQTVVPALRRAGLTESQLNTILVQNPQRALAF
ncbi:MAG: hypothetical protein O3A51_01090 [Verrucomicrobia bacterium]|nr:hypothetical protein [Verrucomicrobiota bacterium]